MLVLVIGYGVVGRSLVQFLTSVYGKHVMSTGWCHGMPFDLMVWDKEPLKKEARAEIESVGGIVCDVLTTSLEQVLVQADWILPSPGVDLSAYPWCNAVIVCELDLLAACNRLPTVGITGSLGKTTTTRLLGALADQLIGQCVAQLPVAIGGNVGIGMLDIAARQDAFSAFIVELSSFQLEHNHTWAPDIAVWTNCFANHLDRHKTMHAYVLAKLNVMRHQKKGKTALLAACLCEGEVGDSIAAYRHELLADVIIVDSARSCCVKAAERLGMCAGMVYCADGQVVFEQNGYHTPLAATSDLSSTLTFMDNWLCVIAALYRLGVSSSRLYSWFSEHGASFTLANEDRCELVATVRGVDFYNDSKATVIQSTYAAAARLAAGARPVIVILGGLGKGVDRAPLLKLLQGLSLVKKIYCFGPACHEFAAGAACYATLDDVFNDLIASVAVGDQVLFSPSGTSFDLYKNYHERGEHFKKLVTAFL